MALWFHSCRTSNRKSLIGSGQPSGLPRPHSPLSSLTGKCMSGTSPNVWMLWNGPIVGNICTGFIEEEPLIQYVLQQECSLLCNAQKKVEEQHRKVHSTVCAPTDNLYPQDALSGTLIQKNLVNQHWVLLTDSKPRWRTFTLKNKTLKNTDFYVAHFVCVRSVLSCSGNSLTAQWQIKCSDYFVWGSGGLQTGNAQDWGGGAALIYHRAFYFLPLVRKNRVSVFGLYFKLTRKPRL